MVSMSILTIPLKSRDDDIGAVETDEANHIFEKHLVVPFFQGFIESFGITEINSTAEKEVYTVVADRGKVFLGSDDTERVE